MDPLTGFLDSLIGQADQQKLGMAGRDLHLHINRHGLDALERHRRDARHHVEMLPNPSQR